MSATHTALRRIQHQISLDRGRMNLDIPVDPIAHAKLIQRRDELSAQAAREDAEAMALLSRREAESKPKPADTPALTPMGMDETLSECETRITFGHPKTQLPKSL